MFLKGQKSKNSPTKANFCIFLGGGSEERGNKASDTLKPPLVLPTAYTVAKDMINSCQGITCKVVEDLELNWLNVEVVGFYEWNHDLMNEVNIT